MGRSRRPRQSGWVLIIVENLPLQRDARVKRQCRSLLKSGFMVAVVCPASETTLEADLASVRLWTWRAPQEPTNPLGFMWEYLKALVSITLLTLQAWRTHGFDVIQACNPPDFLFLIAAPYRLLGITYLFDLHDLSPELYEARFGRRDVLYNVLVFIEKCALRMADRVITTNDSQQRVALDRGGLAADKVTVVRNGPELSLVEPRASSPKLRAGRRYLCCWHGIMGVDEGLDLALAAVANLVHERGRKDCHFAFIGEGERRRHLEALASELDIDDFVSFPGWQPLDVVYDYLATADIGLSPDPKTPSNEQSTAMKVMEYMAFELPVLAFELHETFISAGEAGVYVERNGPCAYAEAIDALLEDEDRRSRMGRVGRERVERELAWDYQSLKYLATVRSAGRV